MLRDRLNGAATPKSRYRYSPPNQRGTKELIGISEWNLGLVGLIFSLLVILIKLYHANRDAIHGALTEKRLISFEIITEDGQVMLNYAWINVLKYSNVWFPILCGILATWFTWLMVYLDSSVPGVYPPSPLSPSRYKVQSGHTFHLNYIFAVFVGLMVSTYLYSRGTSLEFE